MTVSRYCGPLWLRQTSRYKFGAGRLGLWFRGGGRQSGDWRSQVRETFLRLIAYRYAAVGLAGVVSADGRCRYRAACVIARVDVRENYAA